MKLDVFSLIISNLEEQILKSKRSFEIGIDLFDYDENWVSAVSLLLNVYYGSEGTKWIDMYLYRKVNEPDQTQAESEKPFMCPDIESLWKKVEEIRVSEDFEEFTIPQKTTINVDDVFILLSNGKIHQKN